MHSYNWVLENVTEKLRKRNVDQGKLEDSDIENEIDLFKKFLTSLKALDKNSRNYFFVPYKYEDFKGLNAKEWELLSRNLKSNFNTTWNPAQYILIGDDQKDRDNTWWTDKVKPGKDFYWKEFKENILLKKFNLNIVNTVETDVDNVLNNIGNPKESNFERYGMVVGHVQSGKTGNYSSLICKAADAGYKFIVIFSGTNVNNLRNQTQKRLNEAFIGINDDGMCGVSEGRRRERKHIPFRLTTDTKDFDKNTAQRMVGGNFDTISVPIVLIIKKNATILRNLTNWLTDQYREVIADHSMLVIDDEADYASINTKDEDDPATINRLIRLLLGLFNKSAYVAYTATPFANIFIDYKAENPTLGKDLFPKDFIFPIDLPGNYVGAAKLFGSIFEDRNVSLVDIDDHQDVLPIKHKKDFELVALPESLHDAIRVFLINVAIRNLRGHNTNQHNSMLVHVTLYTLVHMRVHNLIDEYLMDIRNAVVSFAKLSNYREQSEEHFRKLEDTFKVQQLEKNENLEYTWSQVLDSIHECIETVIIRQVHSNKKVPQLEYKDSQPLNVIVVGGLSLSRGYTLEGLSVTYFLRGTKLNDTLMQMGRWFGYREGYEDLCRIYLTPDVQDHYAHIQEVTEDLFASFEIMADQGKTPYDFGLAVIEHPDNVLQVTAKNKMKATTLQYVSMNLEGHLKETAWLSKEEKTLTDNLKAIKKILSTINGKSKPKYIGKRNEKSYLWHDIDGKHIEDFLKIFKVYGATKFILRSRMPLDFVQQFAREYNGKWDVSLHGGEGQPYSPINGIEIKAQKRIISDKGSYREVRSRQVSSGSAEAINLPDTVRHEIGDKRKEARAYPNRNHLLMLHILDDHTNENKIIAAYGVSFSGDGTGDQSTIIRINQRMIDEINNFSKLEEEETENEE